ncbi:MAG: DUF4346 domain-containing protein [Deltaproteobacteria bacterium]|nr:DUF4346 domain-containing protein [Deltaproteobacteria bacterium]
MRRALPGSAALAVLVFHMARSIHGAASAPSAWGIVAPALSERIAGYVTGGAVWIGASYALAAAFFTCSLQRCRQDRRRAAAGAAGGLAVGGEEKCRTCECYLDVLRQVQEDLASRGLLDMPEAEAMDEELSRVFAAKSHGCLGCDPCLPVEPFNAVNDLFQTKAAACCAAEGPPSAWPPLPGDYRVIHPTGSVAVCTLADEELFESLLDEPLPDLAILGMLRTENLGVERLVRNVTANSRITRLVLCGADSAGHRAGETVAALADNGVDGEMRVIGSPGKRARLVNLTVEEVAAFRSRVELIQRIGEKRPAEIARLACLRREPIPAISTGIPPAGPIRPETVDRLPNPPMDPTGYFVIDVLPERRMLRLEHYTTEHRITAVSEGKRARDLYLAAVGRGLLSRLDHAAYLGYELGRAERALATGARYIQDKDDAAGPTPVP